MLLQLFKRFFELLFRDGELYHCGYFPLRIHRNSVKFDGCEESKYHVNYIYLQYFGHTNAVFGNHIFENTKNNNHNEKNVYAICSRSAYCFGMYI